VLGHDSSGQHAPGRTVDPATEVYRCVLGVYGGVLGVWGGVWGRAGGGFGQRPGVRGMKAGEDRGAGVQPCADLKRQRDWGKVGESTASGGAWQCKVNAGISSDACTPPALPAHYQGRAPHAAGPRKGL